MAANEFEKNVRKEMDEFKLHPSEEVWPKIEERIREKKRKRRIIFFILFSSIALMLGGYGIYNFSGNKTKSAAQNKLPAGNKPSDKNKTGDSKKVNEETITIKPNIPAENTEQAKKILIVRKQKQVYQSHKEDKLITSISGRDPLSQDQTTINTNQPGKKENYIKSDKTDQETTGISSFNQQPVITGTDQKEIAKPGDKNLTPGDSTGSKLKESNDTRSVQAVNKKKGNKVPGKITWGINFSAGTSVITEDAFSFKSSSTAADKQYTPPSGSNTGGPLLAVAAL